MKNNNKNIDVEFNEDVQKIYLEWFITEPNMFALCRNIIKVDYFDNNLQTTAQFIIDYANENSTLPLPNQIKAKTGVELNKLPDELKSHSMWFIKEIEKFCRTKALELAVYSGVKLINENKGGELEKRIRDAMSISLMTDLGSNYFKDDTFSRLEKMKDRSGFISTGWHSLDTKLYGGFTRGGLNVFAGGSGSGKSLFLQNLAINWASFGYNVVYFSLELSELLIQFRLDAMVTEQSTSEVIRDIPNVTEKIRKMGQTSGDLIIKQMGSGTTINDFRAFLKEYEIKTGKQFDAIVVDYLDLMHPTNIQINPGDLFVKDKYVAEELRGLMHEYDVFGATASQLNRGSTQSQEFDHSHIAGGISKINTADNVFGIFAPDSLKDKGEIELQLLKTRSAASSGQKIKLAYGRDTMRITDKTNGNENIKTELKKEINSAPKEQPKKKSAIDLISEMKNNST